MATPPGQRSWFVYMLRCRDGSLYTGITTDLQRRLEEHNRSPRGARFTRGRRPVALVWAERQVSRAAAARRESGVRRLRRDAKRELIRTAARRPKP